MKKILVLIILLLIFMFPINIIAKRGCRSHHGGVIGCSNGGRQICADGTLSPSCTCTPYYIYGCTDRNAINYNSNANKDDGTCKYYVYGCTDKSALNYNIKANKDDGSCRYLIKEESNITKNTELKENNKEIDNEGDTISGILGLGLIVGIIMLVKKRNNIL